MVTSVRRPPGRVAPTADKYRSKAKDVDVEDEIEDEIEEEEETPRARRRATRTKEPAPRRVVDEVDDDDDDEEEPERERPRSASRKPVRAQQVDDQDEDDEEDEDDPRRGKAKSKSSAGWDKFNKKRESMGDWAHELRIKDDGNQILIKFLDDEPFTSFGQHWIKNDRGTKAYICLETKCPLCDRVGDSPRAVAAFNVLALEEGEEPKPLVWAAGPGIAMILEKKAQAKTGPLTKNYYAVSKVKTGGSSKGPVQYQIDVVRVRDLHDEWGIKPLSESELDHWTALALDEDAYLKKPNRAELTAVAREAMDEED